MNLSIIIESLKYLNIFNLAVSLSRWIYDELSIIKYTDQKLVNSFKQNDLLISKFIIHLVSSKIVLNKIFNYLFISKHNLNKITHDIYPQIKLLLESGVNINEFALKLAMHHENLELIKILTEYKMKLN